VHTICQHISYRNGTYLKWKVKQRKSQKLTIQLREFRKLMYLSKKNWLLSCWPFNFLWHSYFGHDRKWKTLHNINILCIHLHNQILMGFDLVSQFVLCDEQCKETPFILDDPHKSCSHRRLLMSFNHFKSL